jgi:hypothetical protein
VILSTTSPPPNHLDLVLAQLGLFGRPEQVVAVVVYAWVGKGDAALHLVAYHAVPVFDEQLVLGVELDVELKVGTHRPFDERFEPYLPAFEMRCPAHPLHVGDRDRFQPYRLPDTGSAVIPDRMRLQNPVLLAAGLLKVLRVVFHLHRHPLLTRLVQGVGDVCGERSESSAVPCHVEIVDPDVGMVIDGAEMKEHSPLLRNLVFEIAAVPADSVERCVRNPASLAFRCEGNLYGEPPLLQVCGNSVFPLVIKGEVPLTVQGEPVGAL